MNRYFGENHVDEKNVSNKALTSCIERNKKIEKRTVAFFTKQPDPYKKWLNGKMEQFRDIDRKLSYKVANMFECEIKECHNNTIKILAKTDEFKFYMGWYLAKGLGMAEHSWFISKGGNVIDPTLAVPSKASLKKDGTVEYQLKGLKPKDSLIYQAQGSLYSGVEIPRELMAKIFASKLYLQNKHGVLQHRWIQEYYLVSELGLSVEEAVFPTGEGIEGKDKFQEDFERIVNDKT